MPPKSGRTPQYKSDQFTMIQDEVLLVPPGNSRRYQKRFLLVAMVVGMLAFALVYPFPRSGRAWSELFNLAHAPSFFAAFLLFAGLLDPSSVGLPKSWHRILSFSAQRLMWLAGTLLVIGAVCEFLQGFVGRSPSFSDIMANACGLIAGLVWCLGRRRIDRGRRIGLALTAVSLLIAASWSPMAELHECYLQHRELPLLASFERPRELNAWIAHESQTSQTTLWQSDGIAAMQVQGIAGSVHPGANFMWPVIDCNNYGSVELDVYNPGKVQLILRINISDKSHSLSGFDPDDRFKSSFPILPEEKVHIRIALSEVRKAPATRTMDLTQMESMNLFIVRPEKAFVFMVDHVRLVKDGQ
ncbi:MAG: hypothetical protein O2856_05905 [Planctomycetota bacterium]|nr:hypothetical protein [Planctomycetota bacterium]